MVHRIINTSLTLILLSVLILPTSCYYDVEEELYPMDSTITEATYSADVAPIISSSCAISGCHAENGIGTAKNIRLNTYDELIVKVNDGSFEREVLINKSMPPTFDLTGLQLQKIQIWLSDGAPNN